MGVLLDAKANQSTTYTKGEVNGFLSNKPDDAEVAVMLIGINEQIDTKAPLASPTFTGTATVDNLKVVTGVSSDNPLGLTLGGSGVNTLGGLTVNGTALITGKFNRA